VLILQYLEPLGVTQRDCARQAAHQRRHGVAPGPVLCDDGTLWLNLQGRYDLEVERDRLSSTLAKIQPLATV